jgi:DNA polymerase (family 10)
MTNQEIARAFRRLADIMELLGENPFKIKSYQNAYITLRKWSEPLETSSIEALERIPGVGKAISAKIAELLSSGSLETYEKYKAQVPEGVLELLEVPGIGPKKVRSIWQELGVESISEALYACNENRLISLSGFGQKTQQDLGEKLNFYLNSKDRLLGYQAKNEALDAALYLKQIAPDSDVLITGEVRRGCPIVDRIELVWVNDRPKGLEQFPEILSFDEKGYFLKREGKPKIGIYLANSQKAGRVLFETTGSESYLKSYNTNQKDYTDARDEKEFLRINNLVYHEPEWRENYEEANLFSAQSDLIVQGTDIKGIIHCHSTWSDGLHTLEEMAKACISRGYQYLLITDHSKAAFYANGLSIDRVALQHLEIDELNQKLAPFRILKGIESDILSDGSLDYPDEVLATFDIIIASIHSQLKMDMEKAMSRLLTAIKNPYTHILGHLTGRLLLGRVGYPVDHQKIIDACAEHGVAIELNANPNRLDIDYPWIPYAMAKGVYIALSPDAHSIGGLDDMAIGVTTARKGGLLKKYCLNYLNSSELTGHFVV